MTQRPGVLCAVFACLLMAAQSRAATPAQYDGALAQVQAALSLQARATQYGISLPAAQMPARVAARALTPVLFVQRPGGPPHRVNTSLLQQAIADAQAERDSKRRVRRFQELSRQIAALRREVAAPQGETDGRRAVDAARAVLAGGVYDSDPLPPPSKWDRWRDQLDSRIQHWLDSLSPAYTGPTPSISRQFINGIVITLGVALFALLVALLVGLLRRQAARARPLTTDETEAALIEARDTDSLHALAERKAREGDYRLALRFIYLALLVTLDTGGVLRFDRSRTNWEYLRDLRVAGREDVYQALAPLTREFDRVWYGLAHADAADYARALSQYEALQAVSQTAPPGKVAATA